MKFTISMKDPDGVHEGIRDAVEQELAALKGLDADERKMLVKERTRATREKCGHWFEYAEYLVVEVDTEAMTCVVVPCK